MRGVTQREFPELMYKVISTRTPHAGSDRAAMKPSSRSFNFNPHSPCGE